MLAPAETLAVVEPYLRRFGITRVANVTGLDRVGIPVYQAKTPTTLAGQRRSAHQNFREYRSK